MRRLLKAFLVQVATTAAASVLLGGLWDSSQAASYDFTTINVPGSAPNGTSAGGINNAGQIVGDYVGYYGFLDTAGAFTTIYVPGANFTVATSINDAGQIVGEYNNSVSADGKIFYHGFLDTNGTFTSIDSITQMLPITRTAFLIRQPGSRRSNLQAQSAHMPTASTARVRSLANTPIH
jgi:hypothetical protein